MFIWITCATREQGGSQIWLQLEIVFEEVHFGVFFFIEISQSSKSICDFEMENLGSNFGHLSAQAKFDVIQAHFCFNVQLSIGIIQSISEDFF